MIKIDIDDHSGFCFGVVRAIEKAEKELQDPSPLYCLGDIVHNELEVERLHQKGMTTLYADSIEKAKGSRVLIRAHGEPPSTYQKLKEAGIQVIDATCPVVLKLQQRVKIAYETHPKEEWQIVIYGKKGHAEVIGLMGQTENNAIVVEHPDDLERIDFTRNIYLFSQTTKSLNGFNELINNIQDKIADNVIFEHVDTICRQVANRIPNIRIFAQNHDVVLFVSGEKSSNGKSLFEECQKANPNSHLIYKIEDIHPQALANVSSVGICGATSTPAWLMEKVAERVKEIALQPTNN
ncbi:4-hydroxy-3-methylbut-2-enyl diphosphate reductase [Microbacter margulisiae]|uniref:4-hydroxy-3-methylbut-2-enyl diphosphate reductase n=1 Tax=Microbacter margulisiae TaxID=1350067 RepID=A0A7W5DR14_9PORP|nr:4-hydroxy-3-methylbut-2-enyl diphosphate reductase [Microbacter margulisiae]MBB3187396.1 4-hydroxy-3-methylbut-2-enyl diphosphate reductase [Microbacter margulisiae]